MKHISILVPETAVIEAVADPRYLFTAVNQFRIASGLEPPFTVDLVGLTNEIKLTDSLFTVHVDRLLPDVSQTDLIIIPALSGDMRQAIHLNRPLIPWIVEKQKKGSEVASLCLGAFLLASTGLLDGKKCSTHWQKANEFRALFPNVELVDGRIVTEAGGIYSSGGANSYWNLMLYLVEKYTDRETAILAAKYFAIDIDRDSQAAFTIFTGQKEHRDAEVKKAQQFIEENYSEKLTIAQLADLVSVGRRSFERRFKKATNNTVIEYIQRVRTEAAKRHFEGTQKNITDVMLDVGYSDMKAFRDVVKKITGLTPVDYRNKYNKMAAVS